MLINAYMIINFQGAVAVWLSYEGKSKKVGTYLLWNLVEVLTAALQASSLKIRQTIFSIDFLKWRKVSMYK